MKESFQKILLLICLMVPAYECHAQDATSDPVSGKKYKLAVWAGKGYHYLPHFTTALTPSQASSDSESTTAWLLTANPDASDEFAISYVLGSNLTEYFLQKTGDGSTNYNIACYGDGAKYWKFTKLENGSAYNITAVGYTNQPALTYDINAKKFKSYIVVSPASASNSSSIILIPVEDITKVNDDGSHVQAANFQTAASVMNYVNENANVTSINLCNSYISATELQTLSDNLASTNTVIYTTTASTAQNVIVKTTEEGEDKYTCANLNLTDKKDFSPAISFTAQNISYSRTDTKGYNTVCLPFDVTGTEVHTLFGEDAEAYYFTGVETVDDGKEMNFRDVTEGESITAGTPFLVHNTTTESWSINLQNVNATITTTATQSAGVGGTSKGSFVRKTIGENLYKLGSDGTQMVMSTASSTVAPFRFYFQATDN